jgi:hypothetical protein
MDNWTVKQLFEGNHSEILASMWQQMKNPICFHVKIVLLDHQDHVRQSNEAIPQREDDLQENFKKHLN